MKQRFQAITSIPRSVNAKNLLTVAVVEMITGSQISGSVS